jgi:oligoribonuclease (3'-5' exoribonuclease)
MTDELMGWTDLETTGLSARDDVPLELGIIITDNYGREIASRSWLINEKNNSNFQRAILRGKENEFVGPMHEKSGLWDALEKEPTWPRREVDLAAVKFLKDWKVEQGDLPLCGNSIGSLDRPFILVHFPELRDFLSYRNIDMSTFKEICKRRNPGLYENLKPIIGTKELADHRTLSDCRASIREYQTYCEEFLILED